MASKKDLSDRDICTQIVPPDFSEWNINQALAIFRCPQRIVNNCIYLILNEGSEVRSIQTLGVVGQDNISLTQCRELKCPLPPLAEQRKIIALTHNLLTIVDHLEKQVTGPKDQTDQLLQTVLREAFEGN